MAVKPFSKEELNFFKFASIVHDEFPKMLRFTFVTLWNSKIAPQPGYQVWDDTPAVRTFLLTLEGGTTAIPTNESYEDWDCTALFKATIYSKTFAISTTTTIKTLSDQFIKGKKPSPFHTSLTSPTGNQDETTTLAIDQVRLLRNHLCHLPGSSIAKYDFDDYVQHAKDAFATVGFSTGQIDYIGGLEEENFPTERVKELTRKMENHKFLEEKVEKGITALTDNNKLFQANVMQVLHEIKENVIKNQAAWTERSTIGQETRGLAALAALGCDGGSIVFRITAEKVQVVEDIGVDTVTLSEIINACAKVHPSVLQSAVKRGFGDERGDQKFGEIKQGCLLVPLRCLTDERFLEVLGDFDTGRLKERLLEEFSKIGVEIEGLEIEIKNTEEVKKTKEDIRKKAMVMDFLSGKTSCIGESSGKTIDDSFLRAMDDLSDKTTDVLLGEKKDDSSGVTMDDATFQAIHEKSVIPWCFSTEDEENWEQTFKEDVSKHFEKHGLSGIERSIKDKLEKWKHVEINICVTGDSGAGRSTFINVIRGLKKKDKGAAKTGATETTTEETVYYHPKNDKIQFSDLPALGTPKYRDLEAYCKKFKLEKYDIFLIFTKSRFTEYDDLMVEKVKSLEKPFFFIRTHIDVDCQNEVEHDDEQEAFLSKIRGYCLENLKGFETSPEKIFLINNREPAKWDFPRLTRAILNGLTLHRKQSLTMSLTNLSKDLIKRKVEILRGRIWKIAAVSRVSGVVPIPELFGVDIALLKREMNFYKSQLGLPNEEASPEFQRMTPEMQEIMRKFCQFTGVENIVNLMKVYCASSTAVEECSRFIPIIGCYIAGSISFVSTYSFLSGCLNEMGSAALKYLDEVVKPYRVGDDTKRN